MGSEMCIRDREWSESPMNVYVGRTNTYIGATGSKWGNPFRVDDFGREGCIEKFEEMLLKKWQIRYSPEKEKELNNEKNGTICDETSKRKEKQENKGTIITRKTITLSQEYGQEVADNKKQEDCPEIGKMKSWRFIGDGHCEGYECKLTYYLSELRGKTLACWCKPLRCHSDVLANVLFELEVRGAFKELDEIEAKVRDGEEKLEATNCSPVKWDPPCELNGPSTTKTYSNSSSSTEYDVAKDYSVLTSISNGLRKTVEVNEFGIPVVPLSKLPPWNLSLIHIS